MIKNNTIALLPLDNRPVSYLLPKQIADFSGIELILPERKYLGDLINGSDLDYLENWMKNINTTLVISLDNWIYGGLVQSRKHNLSLEELKNRVQIFVRVLRSTPLQNVYAFSSIMRIPNYNNSEEEKDYWKDYGENIFKWSELMYKVGRGVTKEGISHEELLEKWYQTSKLIPPEILSDYKGLRDKNLWVNLEWLETLHNNCFKYLIFSCDDSSIYGMNVVEAEYIKKEISKHKFSKSAKVNSGTDEVPLTLLTKAVTEKLKKIPSLSVYFNDLDSMNQPARYESNNIRSSVLNQLETLDIEVKDIDSCDIILYTHLANSYQGDHILNKKPKDTRENAHKLINLLEKTSKPFILVDLAYANGADPALVDLLISSKINWDNCFGFSAWNTCSNSTGSALAIGINRWIAEKNKTFNKEAFKKCLLTRFLDDFVYQTQVRHPKVTEGEISDKMKTYVPRFLKLLDLGERKINYKLPWNRSFEVEIDI